VFEYSMFPGFMSVNFSHLECLVTSFFTAFFSLSDHGLH
jgi:hypothetical protein